MPLGPVAPGRCSPHAGAGFAAVAPPPALTAAPHRPAVDDGDPKLILVHINHPERIIRDGALGIGRMLQHGLDVFVADVDAILRCLSQRNYRTRRNHTTPEFAGPCFS